MKQNKKRLLFAAVDIGWRIDHYSKFLKTNFSDEVQIESFVKYYVPSEFYKTNYTYKYVFMHRNKVRNWFTSFRFFATSLFKYDIFYFFSGETLLTRKTRRIEFAIYRLFGKRIIMHFVGSDVRNPKYLIWKEKNIFQFLIGEDSKCKTLPFQDLLIRDSIKYADSILVSTPDLLTIVPQSKYYPVMLNVDQLKIDMGEVAVGNENKQKITILHAPSNPALKGTRIIHEVLRKISKESNYEIELIFTNERALSYSQYSVTRYELFELIKKSDIVIDQLIIGWYGLQALEAIVGKCQVVSYIGAELTPNLFPDCPIENANALNLEMVVLHCIENHIHNRVDFNKNIEWVKKYHGIEANNALLVKSIGLNNK